MSFITVEILDKDGNLCPNAENDMTFAVEGAGFIAGVDNGSPISMEKFKGQPPQGFLREVPGGTADNGEPGGVKVTATLMDWRRRRQRLKLNDNLMCQLRYEE